MESNAINEYLNEYVNGNEKDNEIECTRNQYGVVRIIVRAKYIPCSCCKTEMKRDMLENKRWTDGQGLKREAKMCPTCSAVAKDLYGI